MTVEWLAVQLIEHNIELTETQKQQFQTYYRLLVVWNQKMTFSRITSEYDV